MPATMTKPKAKKPKVKGTKRTTSAENQENPIFNKSQWAKLETFERYFAGFVVGGKADGTACAIVAALGTARQEGEQALTSLQIAGRIERLQRVVSLRLKRLITHKIVAKQGRGYALTVAGETMWETLEPHIE